MPVSTHSGSMTFTRKVELLNEYAKFLPPFVRNSAQPAKYTPIIDSWNTPTCFTIKAYLPEVSTKNLRLDVKDGAISLVAKTKNRRNVMMGGRYHRFDRLSKIGYILKHLGKSYKIKRQISIPYDSDISNISVKFRYDLLEINVFKLPNNVNKEHGC